MTTAAERQSRRRQKLNQIAQDAGYQTWVMYETEIIKKGKIEMNARVYKLEIYNADTEEWIDTIYGTTEWQCIETAEERYGSNNEYHWTNPVEV